jgi:hypothetical protein
VGARGKREAIRDHCQTPTVEAKCALYPVEHPGRRRSIHERRMTGHVWEDVYDVQMPVQPAAAII